MSYQPDKLVTLTLPAQDWLRVRNAMASKLTEPMESDAGDEEMIEVETDERGRLMDILARVDLTVMFDNVMEKSAAGETYLSFYCPCCGKDRE